MQELADSIGKIDDTYLKTLGMKLVEGRNFSYTMAADTQGSVIINQAMAKKLNLKSPIGARITNGYGKYTVIGVVEDFNYQSMRDHIESNCTLILALALLSYR